METKNQHLQIASSNIFRQELSSMDVKWDEKLGIYIGLKYFSTKHINYKKNNDFAVEKSVRHYINQLIKVNTTNYEINQTHGLLI